MRPNPLPRETLFALDLFWVSVGAGQLVGKIVVDSEVMLDADSAIHGEKLR